MAYTTIDKPNEYFNTVLYTGNGSTQSVTGVGFQPDWVWLKARDTTYNHQLFDSVRGATIRLFSDLTNAESTNASSLTSFDSDGFSIGNIVGINESPRPYVSWNWLAGGTASSNTDGSITSQVSANTTSGFSIVSYTGTGSTATVGHGLSQTPEMVIVKKRDSAGTDWITWGSVLGGTVGSEFVKLNNNTAKTTGLNSSWFNNTAPDSDVFTVGTQSDLNGSSSTYIGYCFHSVKGYSKFGQYTGNGSSTDGTFVYTGFKPAFLMIKPNAAENWHIFDNTRSPINAMQKDLRPNLSNAESDSSASAMDFLSNGFKFYNADPDYNFSSVEYFYMCFAENPFVTSTGIPATAR